jgi:Asp-tRNA(Asn)/Glu-tRNA(Gln) amidotransferase C subunit
MQGRCVPSKKKEKMKLAIGLILIILTIGFLYSCNSNKTQKLNSEKGELKTIKISKLQQNAIVHEKLSDEQINRITKFKETLKEVDTTPLEKTIENFQRDLNPDKEIAIWERIAEAYKYVNSENKNLRIDEKNEVYNLFLYRSMMPKEQVLQKVKLKSLSLDKAKEFIKYYDK